MIEGIKEIGEFSLTKSSSSILEALVQDIPLEGNKTQYLVIINFDLENKKISLDKEEIRKSTPLDYLWIGNPKAGNSPQDRLTTNNLAFLCSQTIPNLIERLDEGELKNILSLIKNLFFYDLGKQIGQQNRYRYVLDVKKFGLSNKSIEQIKKEALEKNKNGYAKEVVKVVTKEVFSYLKEKEGISKREIALFTIKCNDKLLVSLPEYHTYIANSVIEEKFGGSTRGVCHLCKKEEVITYDTTQFRFTYYNTDKIGFSSGLRGKSNDGFLKNLGLCKNCYKSLLAGETFIKNHLSTSLIKSLLIIPQLIFSSSYMSEILEEWAENVKSHFNAVRNLENWKMWQALKNQLTEYKEIKDAFVIHLLFYEASKSEFKILKLIPDVPPSRIETLLKTANELQDKAQEILGGKDSEWYLGLDDMYYLFPVRKSKNEFVDYKKVLEFYDALFTDKPVAYDFLIRQFVELAAIYRHGAICNYNIGRRNCQENKWNEQKRDMALVKAILNANLLLLYLKELTQLDGGLSMSEKIFSEIISNLQRKKESVSGAKKKANIESQLHQYERLQRFIEEMGYSSLQIGLFLLGFLIGEIGKAQYDSSNKTKPILKKINYQGMDKGKILRLVNDVLEKLDQYKILSYNEVIYAEMKKLLDKNWQSWNISNEEAVFFVLSGYAYATYRAILKGEIKSEETNDVNKEEGNE